MAQNSNKNGSKTPIVTFEDVHIKFGDKVVLAGASLDVYENETLALIGGSGAGKSVLVRSLIGLERPQKGKIFFRGTNILDLSENKIIDVRKRIAYAFQFGALFDSLSVYDNLAYPLREHTKMSEEEIRNRIMDVLHSFGLEESSRLFPSNLSGGMQKRVGVARAIILDPEIILYDEPTSGLDPFNAKNINDLIIKLQKKGRTSIVITHDMHSAFYVADRIAMLYNGKIAYSGLTEEVKASDNKVVKAFITGEPV